MILITIQATEKPFASWSEVTAVKHNVDNWEEGVKLAYCISHMLGNVTVRLTQPSATVPITADYISRLNGCYIQSTEPITPEEEEDINDYPYQR